MRNKPVGSYREASCPRRRAGVTFWAPSAGRGGCGPDGSVGIPFAKPPVGDLRWRAPQPVVDWDGVRSALDARPWGRAAPAGLGLDLRGRLSGRPEFGAALRREAFCAPRRRQRTVCSRALSWKAAGRSIRAATFQRIRCNMTRRRRRPASAGRSRWVRRRSSSCANLRPNSSWRRPRVPASTHAGR